MKKVAALVLGLSAGCLGTPAFAGPPALAKARAQGTERGDLVRLELRVSATRAGGTVTVDRGASDGLAVGDFVELNPREGGLLEGTIIAVDPRSATVELHDRALLPPAGTRGRVWVPRDRIKQLARSQKKAPVQERPEHAPWVNEDEEWTEGMPLLAQVKAVRPEDRAVTYQARNYLIVDQHYNTVGDRWDGFYRLGSDMVVDNLFGKGGELHVDSEYNHRFADLPYDVDIDDGDFRLDRLSYLFGGDRFARDRWQGGRFLIHDMPEFGLIDGAQWTRRLENGHRFGAIMGFMPEPNGGLESGHDFQIGGYYRWVADATERLTATGGFQKTWHDGSQDRDLFVVKVRYLPVEGWRATGTAWVDLYDGSTDVNKGSGTELTQAVVTAYRTWESGNGMRATYRHLKFPELLRNEFNPIDPADLALNKLNRAAVRGWRYLSEDMRLEAEAGVWDDEDEDGYDFEFGVGVTDMFRADSRSTVAVFMSEGEFSTLYGVRAGHGWRVENGRWDLHYEFSNNDQAGFTADNDDAIQHELHAGRDFRLGQAWDLSVGADARSFNEEESLSLAVYVQQNMRGTL